MNRMAAASPDSPRFAHRLRRVVLKLSGEALVADRYRKFRALGVFSGQ